MAGDNTLNLLQWGISIAVPAVAGLVGVAVGAMLTAWREKTGRRHEFLVRQLTEFYSPMLSIRQELKTQGEVRIKISGAANTAWRRMCDRCEGQPRELQKNTAERRKAFDKIIEYNNELLVKDAIPSYHAMIDIFRKNMWLAEPSTICHFPALLEFVNIWDRFLAESLPSEVIEHLDHSEESLHPLYDDLQRRHDELREKLANG